MSIHLEPFRRGAVTAALFAVFVTACSSAPSAPPPTTGPSPTTTIAPSPTEVGGPASGPCAAAAIELAHSRTDGAAGSRFTTLVVTVSGAAGCELPAGPTVELVAAGGEVLATAEATGAAPLQLAPGETASSTIQLANWCAAIPTDAVSLTLVLGTETVEATGGPFPPAGEFPPCNGGAELVFSATAWARP